MAVMLYGGWRISAHPNLSATYRHRMLRFGCILPVKYQRLNLDNMPLPFLVFGLQLSSFLFQKGASVNSLTNTT
jgi:hypothetical protein